MSARGRQARQEWTRFVIGGETYPDWSQVPQRYKAWDPSQHDSERSRATLFRFES